MTANVTVKISTLIPLLEECLKATTEKKDTRIVVLEERQEKRTGFAKLINRENVPWIIERTKQAHNNLVEETSEFIESLEWLEGLGCEHVEIDVVMYATLSRGLKEFKKNKFVEALKEQEKMGQYNG